VIFKLFHSYENIYVKEMVYEHPMLGQRKKCNLGREPGLKLLGNLSLRCHIALKNGEVQKSSAEKQKG
jgi:hypothetical protein